MTDEAEPYPFFESIVKVWDRKKRRTGDFRAQIKDGIRWINNEHAVRVAMLRTKLSAEDTKIENERAGLVRPHQENLQRALDVLRIKHEAEVAALEQTFLSTVQPIRDAYAEALQKARARYEAEERLEDRRRQVSVAQFKRAAHMADRFGDPCRPHVRPFCGECDPKMEALMRQNGMGDLLDGYKELLVAKTEESRKAIRGRMRDRHPELVP